MSLKAMLLKRFGKTYIYRWVIRKVLPFLNFRIWGFPTYPMEKYFEIRERILSNPNEIYAFVGVSKLSASYLANKIITGAKWSHAGFLYIDAYKEIRMLHMLGTGLEDWSLLTYLREVDDFDFGPLPIPEENKLKVLTRIYRLKEHQSDIVYDFDFNLTEDLVTQLDTGEDFGHPKLYCSEEVWVCCYGLVNGDAFSPREVLERKMFEPDDVYDAFRKIE